MKKEEINMLTSTIDLRDTYITSKMVDMKNIFSINGRKPLDQKIMAKIGRKNFSYVFLYEGDLNEDK